MSGVSFAVGPRRDPEEVIAAPNVNPEVKPQRRPHQLVVGGVMGSLRVIELQLVAFIMVFSISGLVPFLDLVFPAFSTAYLLILSRFTFPSHWGPSSRLQEIFQGSRWFQAYVVLGTAIGLFLPLAYVLGGFARGDDHVMLYTAGRLFVMLDWMHDVWQNKTLPANAELKKYFRERDEQHAKSSEDRRSSACDNKPVDGKAD